MSRMLRLLDAGIASLQSLAAHRHRPDALAQIRRWLVHPNLPAPVAAEAHRLAGELLTDSERYPEARRHFRAAAAIAPNHGRTFYLWGLAHEKDPHGCDRRAALRFREALRHEPTNALYRAAFGRAAVRCKRTRIGVRELLAAANAAPGDIAVLRMATDGLLLAGRFAAAQRMLNRARFLRPTDRQLKMLEERVRFEKTRHEQGRTTRHRHGAELAMDGGRVVLPFVRVARQQESRLPVNPTRRDVVSLPRPHLPRLRVRRADR